MPEALNILVVEDDAPLRDAVCLTLEMSGYGAMGVGSGVEALAEVDRRPYSLVISDLKMQPMDGLLQRQNTAACIDACLAHPAWRLSLQTHKLTGIR